jgi:hypothetical protein
MMFFCHLTPVYGVLETRAIFCARSPAIRALVVGEGNPAGPQAGGVLTR